MGDKAWSALIYYITELISLPQCEVRIKRGGNLVNVGYLLQTCRERAKMNQMELALELNRTQSTISRIETGIITPDFATTLEWIAVTGAQEVGVALIYGIEGIRIANHLKQEARV